MTTNTTDTTSASPWANGADHEAKTGAEGKAKQPMSFKPGTAQAIALQMVEELEGCGKTLRLILETAAEMEAEKPGSEATSERSVMLMAGIFANGHHDKMNRLSRRMLVRLEELDPEAVAKDRFDEARLRGF